jgi:hypothetical protein
MLIRRVNEFAIGYATHVRNEGFQQVDWISRSEIRSRFMRSLSFAENVRRMEGRSLRCRQDDAFRACIGMD